LVTNRFFQIVVFLVKQGCVNIVKLLGFSIANVEDRLPIVVGQIGMNAPGMHLADTESPIVPAARATDKAGVLGEIIGGLSVRVDASAGLQDDVEEGHGDL
jgi:hypothetical protein